MQARRNFLGLVTAWFLAIRTKAQTSGRAPAKELARHALTGAQAGLEAILVEVTALPGVPSTVVLQKARG